MPMFLKIVYYWKLVQWKNAGKNLIVKEGNAYKMHMNFSMGRKICLTVCYQQKMRQKAFVTLGLLSGIAPIFTDILDRSGIGPASFVHHSFYTMSLMLNAVFFQLHCSAIQIIITIWRMELKTKQNISVSAASQHAVVLALWAGRGGVKWPLK